MDDELHAIGSRLVEASEEDFQPSASDLLQELFPYIWQAARRMSTREIVAWLKANHGIEISQSSISRALRNADKHWERFADFIEPQARVVADGVNLKIDEVLYDDGFFDEFIKVPTIFGDSKDEVWENLNEFDSAVWFLKQNWFALNGMMRSCCYKYFKAQEEGENDVKD